MIGGQQTSASSFFPHVLTACPRISTKTAVPNPVIEGGTYASAIFFPNVGEGDPLVTTPISFPFSSTQRYPSRAIPRSTISKPTSARFNPSAFNLTKASRPINAPFSKWQYRSSPASQTLIVSLISCPYNAIFDSRRKVFRAPSPHAKIPNSFPAANTSFHTRSLVATSDGT